LEREEEKAARSKGSYPIMTKLETIFVPLGKRSYPIYLGRDWLASCAPQVHRATPSKTFFLLSVKRVHDLYGKPLMKALGRLGRVDTCLMPEGESAKNEKTLLTVLRAMAAFRLQRDACLVTLGGGVVGDMGGLASALYMRGIDVIQCPTTLLAQVDASVGGKTAIDFEGVKNLVGVFHQPKAVLLDTAVLGSLSDRIYKSGLAEVVKYGVIRDPVFFKWLETNVGEILGREPKLVAHLVRRSCEIKASVVSADERESGVRAHLNFGHTIGHGLESAYDNRGLQHGEAVAYGMWAAALLSWRLQDCGEDVPDRIEALLRRLGLLKPFPPLSEKSVYQLLSLDKKARMGKTQFVLTKKIGVVSMHMSVPKSLIGWVLRRLRHPKIDVSDLS
jgi:3-dehydroquinate synthase